MTSTNDFEARRLRLLECLAEPALRDEKIADPNQDLFGGRAIANLVLGRRIKEANRHLRHVASWFDHPHPNGRTHDGECDFTAMKLALVLHLFRNDERLESATYDQIRRFFLTRDFKSKYGSENHALLFQTSRCLTAQIWPEETFQAYGEKGERLYVEDLAWLKYYIRFRARRGWGEFDSSCYFSAVWECLLALYDYCADEELRHLSEQMLNLRLAAQIMASLNGMTVGAQGRIYAAHALDHRRESTYPVFYLYFDNVPQTFIPSTVAIDSLVSKFKPHALLTGLALHRKDAYEHRERIHLHNTADVLPRNPTPGSIRKYTYWTADYALGCVQFQDPYPKNCAGAWYAHHEQHQWDLSFPTHPQARLFTHHPGKNGFEHGYWTGDLGCGCGHFFQNRTALTALYKIPANQPYDFIHAFVPRSLFDEVVEEHGWIFVRAGVACAGLKLFNGHEWADAPEADKRTANDVFVPTNAEVRSPGRENAAICEVGRMNDFGGFDSFRREIAGNELSFDPAQMRLRYVSQRSGALEMDARGTRLLNGKPVDLDYPLFGGPHLKSGWDEGFAELHWNEQILTFDFRESQPTSISESE